MDLWDSFVAASRVYSEIIDDISPLPVRMSDAIIRFPLFMSLNVTKPRPPSSAGLGAATTCGGDFARSALLVSRFRCRDIVPFPALAMVAAVSYKSLLTCIGNHTLPPRAHPPFAVGTCPSWFGYLRQPGRGLSSDAQINTFIFLPFSYVLEVR